MKFVKLKIYQNKRTKQRTVVLPAKLFKFKGKAPKEVEVKW